MDLNEIFERWAIMTTDGAMSDNQAIAFIARKQGSRAADFLTKKKKELDLQKRRKRS